MQENGKRCMKEPNDYVYTTLPFQICKVLQQKMAFQSNRNEPGYA